MKTSFLLLAVSACIASAAPAQVHVTVPGVNVPNPGRNDVTIDTNRNTKTVTCRDGGGFYLRGNMNTIHVAGSCATVHILGNRNTVDIEQRTQLITEGNNNTVSYADPKTTVSTMGNGNTVGQTGR